MTGIVLSAAVRQNLLSLQSTASLLATTQNDLATGNKVNSALDNPTEFFTAQGLNNRASDIGNLLDSIGNGVQVLQAANTGITSLQSLIANAQSIANQVLQQPAAFTTHSSVTSAAISGATAQNLLGSPLDATFAGAPANADTSAPTSGKVTAGAFTAVNVGGAATAATNAKVTSTVNLTGGLTDPGSNVTFTVATDGGAAKTVTLTTGTGTGTGTAPTKNFTLTDIEGAINGTAGIGVNASDDGAGHLVLTSTGTAGSADTITVAGAGAASVVGTATSATGAAAVAAATDTFTVALDGGAAKTITLSAANVAAFTTAGGTLAAGDTASSLSAQSVASIVNFQLNNNATGGPSVASVTGGALVFTSPTTGGNSKVVLTAENKTGNGVAGSTGIVAATNTGTAATTAALTTGTLLSGAAPSAGSPVLAAAFANNDTLTVDGKTLTFSNTAATSTSATGGTISTGGTVQDVLSAIDKITGATAASSITGGAISIHTGTASDLSITSSNNAALQALGLEGAGVTTGASQARAPAATSGQTLTIAATLNGTATNITFGTGAGQVSTLDQLNSALLSNNLQASINATGQITITTDNDAASEKVGAIGGTATATGAAFAGVTAGGSAPSGLDPTSQAARANLVKQYNNVLAQINTTSQDSSFNGINLLNGDTLNLTFDETGASKLSIQGVIFNAAGLGLAPLTAGTDFQDSDSANAVLSQLQGASTSLRSEASALGSNLSIVEIRQDFNKNLINVLQTGASNLTLADTNQEAANSQALSTRQSIAVSALALANQSQQSVLQLLR